MPLPPGPKTPASLQSFAFMTRPIPFVQRMRAQYGDIFTMKMLDYGDIVYVADTAAIKQIFTGSAEVFHAGEANEVMEPVAGANSLLLLDEDAHMRQRKLMLPPFHGESIKRYAELIAEIADAEIDGWPEGQAFATRPAMQRITLEVIMRAVFGIDDAARLAHMREQLPALFDLNIVAMFIPILRCDLGAWSPWGKFLRAREQVDAVLYDEIARRRAQEGANEAHDILSLLMSARDEEGEPMSDRQLRDELITLLLAGHETTATALAWAFERLVRNPEARERLEDEIRAGQDAYVDAVVKETLRVRPVVMDVARKITAPITLCGYDLPAGSIVMPAIALVQLSPELFDEPTRFMPERFLPRGAHDGDGQPQPYTWIPFGGGQRRCIGASFAQLEMKIVLERVLSRCDLRVPDGDRTAEETRVRGVTLVPANGGRVRFAARTAERSEGDVHVEPARA